MITTLILFYLLGFILSFIYLVETQQTSDPDQRMIMFCCSLVWAIYVLYLLQSRLSYFTPKCLLEEDENTQETDSKLEKIESMYYGFH